MKITNNNNFKILILFLFPLISLIVSIYQAQFAYDGFHWGLILFNATKFLEGEILYKEIFVHYGFLTTIINAILLKVSNENILFVFSFYSLCYSLGLFFAGLIAYKLTNNLILGFFTILILFFLHPFTIFPWHSYLTFFLISIYLYFKCFKITEYQNLILFLCCVINESFIYPVILIIIFDILFEPIFLRRKINLKKLKINLLILTLFLFFIFFFFKINDKFEYWLNFFELPNIFLNEIHKQNIFEIIYTMFSSIAYYSVNRFFSEPQWFIYLLIILVNSFFLIHNLFNFKKDNSELIYISFISLILMSVAIHNVTIFKFSTGLSFGLIIVMSLIFKIKDYQNKILIFTIIFFISLIAFELKKNNSNHLFVKDFQSKENLNSNNFDYFKSQKWSSNTWKNLNFLDKTALKIKNECNIVNGYNLTKDAFYSVIINKHMYFDQFVPWFQNKDKHFMNAYFFSINKHFDPNLFLRISKNIKNNNIFIVAYKENYNQIFWGEEKYNFSDNMNYMKLPSYDYLRDVVIIYPKNCFLD